MPPMYRSIISIADIPIQDIPETVWLLSAKIVGAILGSAISIAYLLPKGRRDAAIRFAVGVSIGFVFGPLTANQLSEYFALNSVLSKAELFLMGSLLASLCAWWALGILHRLAHRLANGTPGASISQIRKK